MAKVWTRGLRVKTSSLILSPGVIVLRTGASLVLEHYINLSGISLTLFNFRSFVSDCAASTPSQRRHYSTQLRGTDSS